MRKRRLLLPLLGVAALATPAVGCGGGEDGEAAQAGADTALTEAQYVKRATALCRRIRSEISTELDGAVPRGAAGKDAAARAMEDVLLPGFRTQYEGLRRLWPPRGDEDFLDLMLSKFSRALENGEEDLGRFFRLKLSSYSEFAEGTLMTREYGIEGCGSLGRSPQAVVAAF